MRNLYLLIIVAVLAWPGRALSQSNSPEELILAFELDQTQTLKEVFEFATSMPGVRVAGGVSSSNMLLLRLEKPERTFKEQVLIQLISKGYHFAVKEGSIELVLMQMGESVTALPQAALKAEHER